MCIRIPFTGLLLSVCLLGACGGGNKPGVSIDSLGKSVERGANSMGQKLDTAFTGIKTDLHEADLQRMLHQIDGMDSIKLDLTKDGYATLTGSVPTAQKKSEAVRLVRVIKGITSVTDSLRVVPVVGSGNSSPDSERADSAVTGRPRKR